MSSICLCAISTNDNQKVGFYKNKIMEISKKHQRGTILDIDWNEPIIEFLKKTHMVVSLTDSEMSTNCERLILPDGWYFNGVRSTPCFKERMLYLFDIAETLLSCEEIVEFYIATSGELPGDYQHETVKLSDLTDFLCSTIGKNGADFGLCITVRP